MRRALKPWRWRETISDSGDCFEVVVCVCPQSCVKIIARSATSAAGSTSSVKRRYSMRVKAISWPSSITSWWRRCTNRCASR